MHSAYVEDEVLWLKIRQGDRHAYEALYRRLFRLLYRYGGKITTSKLVKDAIHDLFLDIWFYRAKLQATTSVRYYLFTSLKRRIALNNQRNERSSFFDFKADLILNDESHSAEAIIVENEFYDEQIEKLKKHLQNLPSRQYEALMMKYYSKMSYPEIAVKLDVNEQSARNLVQRALELLRKYSQISITASLVFCKCLIFTSS